MTETNERTKLNANAEPFYPRDQNQEENEEPDETNETKLDSNAEPFYPQNQNEQVVKEPHFSQFSDEVIENVLKVDEEDQQRLQERIEEAIKEQDGR